MKRVRCRVEVMAQGDETSGWSRRRANALAGAPLADPEQAPEARVRSRRRQGRCSACVDGSRGAGADNAPTRPRRMRNSSRWPESEHVGPPGPVQDHPNGRFDWSAAGGESRRRGGGSSPPAGGISHVGLAGCRPSGEGRSCQGLDTLTSEGQSPGRGVRPSTTMAGSGTRRVELQPAPITRLGDHRPDVAVEPHAYEAPRRRADPPSLSSGSPEPWRLPRPARQSAARKASP
jgi:hypothetical protein